MVVSLLALAFSACSPLGLLGSGADETPRAWYGQNQSLRIPGGETCLEWLPRRGIRYRRLDDVAGVATPVEVSGPIAGVRYVVSGEQSVVADCRLILALDWIGPSLRELGVVEVRHSGAYVYRTQRNGRPSLHARGLAIDVHEIVLAEQRADVRTNFARGRGNGCAEGDPSLNRLVCRLRALQLFQELITPDHNADHYDHIHLAISPRGSPSAG